ncbi:S-layer homology domain-containing protein [Paenibacillus sp. YIM B09110]|uniref:S-layer homology domain-containing protein n=1 Tax=Paenibacillus sp. YIM B09110 TaxID=3126102 RepID=UPI00301CD35C
MIRNSFQARMAAVLMSILLALGSLGVSGTASAASYTPKPSETPPYTGPLTWMDFTDSIYSQVGSSSVTDDVYVPYSLAIDEDDNFYVTEFGGFMSDDNIAGKLEILSDNGQSVTEITYDSDVTYPLGIAVDEDKNVYVTDNTTSGSNLNNDARILKLDNGTDSWIDITHGETLRYAMGVAADREGNVYAVDSSNNGGMSVPAPRILKLSSGDTEWDDITNSAFATLSNVIVFDIVVDGEGNLFIGVLPYSGMSNGGGGEILKLPAGTSDWINVTPATTTGAMPFLPYGMGIDVYDNVHVVSFVTGSIMKLGYNGDSNDWTELEAMPAAQGIFDVAADSSGHVYSTNIFRGNISTLRASVIYDGNGSSSGTAPLDDRAYEPDEIATVADEGDLEKTGYVFTGWATSPDTTTVEYDPGDTIDMTQSIQLYAVWTPIPTYTVSYQAGTGGSISGPSSEPVIEGGTPVSVPTATADSGYTFVGWNSNGGSRLLTEDQVATTVVSRNITYTARFKSDRSNSTPEPTDPGIEIILDGVKQEQLATAQKSEENGRNVTTVVLDSSKVIDKLNRDNNKLLTIPVTGDSQDIIVQLNGSLLKTLVSKDGTIEIITDKATYTLPAAQLNINDISSQLGKDVKLEDITISIRILETSETNKNKAQAAAQEKGAQLISAPIDFEITATYGSKSVNVSQFNSYVERSIVIPNGTDPNNITTGVVLTPNGELHHVPTAVEQREGKTYANVNSLTNSTYAVIYNPSEMEDVKNHWAKADVNDMYSRLIVQGVTATEFDPDSSITRAEFLAIVMRALGIQEANYENDYKDVSASNWFAGAVQAATDYNLISGYDDGSFRPNARISRQEATVVLARATSIAKLKSELNAEEVNRMLTAFADGGEVSAWARNDVAAAISLELLKGHDGKLDPESDLSRAEAAALVRRLLQAANLINR